MDFSSLICTLICSFWAYLESIEKSVCDCHIKVAMWTTIYTFLRMTFLTLPILKKKKCPYVCTLFTGKKIDFLFKSTLFTSGSQLQSRKQMICAGSHIKKAVGNPANSSALLHLFNAFWFPFSQRYWLSALVYVSDNW